MWRMSLVAPRHVESSWNRNRTHIPCTGRQSLNHWPTREVLLSFLKKSNVNTLVGFPMEQRPAQGILSQFLEGQHCYLVHPALVWNSRKNTWGLYLEPDRAGFQLALSLNISDLSFLNSINTNLTGNVNWYSHYRKQYGGSPQN